MWVSAFTLAETFCPNLSASSAVQDEILSGNPCTNLPKMFHKCELKIFSGNPKIFWDQWSHGLIHFQPLLMLFIIQNYKEVVKYTCVAKTLFYSYLFWQHILDIVALTIKCIEQFVDDLIYFYAQCSIISTLVPR